MTSSENTNAPKLYYPVGNTPPVDVTLGCHVPRQCDVLLMGCGDIRNVLYTTHLLQQNGTFSSSNHKINVHLNDIESGIITRDLILLKIVKTMNPDDEADMKFLWSVWYDVMMSKKHLDRLQDVIQNIHQTKFEDQNIFFGNGKTQEVVEKVLLVWKQEVLKGTEIHEKRLMFLKERIKEEFPENKAKDIASRLYLQCYKLLDDKRLKDRYIQETQEYLETGITRFSSPSGSPKDILPNLYANMTFLLPQSNKWCVPEDSSPFMCYGVEQNLDQYDGAQRTISYISLTILKEWVKSFQDTLKSCSVQIYLWLEDANILCEKTLPKELTFDFIDTSNLADDKGLVPLLNCCQQKLKEETGVVRTESFYWHRCLKQGGKIEQFLHKCIDISPLMYPTILGLHLAEELELGHENILGGGSFEGCDKIELRWRKATARFSPLEVEDLIYISEKGDQDNTDAVTSGMENMKVDGSKNTAEDNRTTLLDDATRSKIMDRLKKLTIREAVQEDIPGQQSDLKVVKEYRDWYVVQIKTTPEGKLSFSHDNGDTKAVAFKLVNGSTTDFITTLRFLCPVLLEDSTQKYSRRDGLLEVTLIKDRIHTVGERVMPWKQLSASDVASLQDYPLTDLGVNSLWLYRMWVYPREDMVQSLDVQYWSTAVHQLQDLLEVLMIPDPATKELIQKSYVPKKGMLVAGPIFEGYHIALVVEEYKTFEQKPTLFLTVHSSDEAHKLIREGKMTLLQMWQELGLGGYEIHNSYPLGFKMLEDILHVNSSRMTQDPSEGGRWKTRSFLRMRYPFTPPHMYYKSVQACIGTTRREIVNIDPDTHVCLLRSLEHCRGDRPAAQS